MLDKSVPHISAIMVNHDATNYPEFHLPEGYSFCFYKDGLEEDWCRLQLETGQVLSMDSIRAGLKRNSEMKRKISQALRLCRGAKW